MSLHLLRTPDERFTDLPDFAHAPTWVHVRDPTDSTGTVRVATYVVDPAVAPPRATVVVLHGEPTWSYLYRHIIDAVVGAGLRVVAVDLVGFGRSDKPAAVADHTYARHVEWVRSALFDALDLRGVVLLGQDWGGLIGLRLLAEHPDRFAGAVAANTGLPTGDHPMPAQWWRFRQLVESVEELSVSRLVAAGCTGGLAADARAAYDAPFPDGSFQAGPRALPLLVPTRPDDAASAANRAAWDVLGRLDLPFGVAFSGADPITGPMAAVLAEHVPTATVLSHPALAGAGHFLQEDAGRELGEVVADFVTGSVAGSGTALSRP